MIKLKELSIGYKNTSLLSSITTTVNKGDLILLVGKNGSGKSTLLKTLYKELPPIYGSIYFYDRPLNKIPNKEIGKLISVVLPVKQQTTQMNTWDLLTLGYYPYKKWYQSLSRIEVERAEEILYLLNLEKYRNFSINELSDGNLQKAYIGRALIQDCPIIILDEPTSFLDITAKMEISKLLTDLSKTQKKTIIFTSHDFNLGLSISNKIWLIKDHYFKAGFTEDIALQEDILNYFSGSKFKFNFNSEVFENQNKEKKFPIELEIENSTYAYWAKKALTKNRFIFNITEKSDLKLKNKKNQWILIYKEKKHFFLTLEELISFLKNIVH